jgi:hypothetical protein
LLAIVYDTGAQVILQGPCSYTVDSDRGGFLQVGKLTALVEKKTGGQGESKRGRGGEGETGGQELVANGGTLATRHSPLATTLFAIRTPTAIVSDLGTEFGVEVVSGGITRSYVFRGKVIFAATNAGQPTDEGFSLTAEQSAQTEVSGDGKTYGAVRILHDRVASETYVRYMPAKAHRKVMLANLRGDYDRHLDSRNREHAKNIQDTIGQGQWGFYGCNHVDPSEGEMTPLAYKAVGNNPTVTFGYGGTDGFSMPAISNTILFHDGVNPQAGEVAMHPGETMRSIVVRWTAGESEAAAGDLFISGSVRRAVDKPYASDGVHLYIYVDGKCQYDLNIVGDNVKKHQFLLPKMSVRPGQHVDFVLDRNESMKSDETMFSINIYRLVSSEDAKPKRLP